MWSLKKTHQLGELIAAVAVVISLVFVGYEVQQNSEVQSQMATEAVVRDFVGAIRSLSTNAEMACIYASGVQDFGSLSGSERLRLSAYLLGVYYAIQEMHSLTKRGAIDPGTWRGFDRLSQENMELPGVRQWFATRRHWFSDDFQLYVEELTLKPSPVNPVIYDDPACSRNDGS